MDKRIMIVTVQVTVINTRYDYETVAEIAIARNVLHCSGTELLLCVLDLVFGKMGAALWVV